MNGVVVIELEQRDQSDIDAENAVFEKQAKKAARNAELQSITVTVDGLVFDAGKESRDLMSQAVDAATTLGIAVHQWKMADNSWKSVTLDQLKKAQALGLQRHAEILAKYS